MTIFEIKHDLHLFFIVVKSNHSWHCYSCFKLFC